MIENYYTATYKADHCTYGGKIYDYDFNGYNSLIDISQRILSDSKFDKKCKLLRERKMQNDRK